MFLRGLFLCAFSVRLFAAEADALQISTVIQQRHSPYGAILDPVFAASDSDQIVGYTRCGDSAIWTGHYLAAEAFRYKVTRDPAALANAWRALSALRVLVYVTGNNLLARCAVPVDSPYAAGIASEESGNGIHFGTVDLQGYNWVGNTSRDQYSGVFFGLAAAWDLIDDPAMPPTIEDLVWRMLDNLEQHGWTVFMPDGSISTTFVARPDQELTLLQIGRHIMPKKFSSDYTRYAALHFFLTLAPVAIETEDPYSSYFKFNLDTINLYNLVRLEDNSLRRLTYRKTYDVLRNTTDDHQNAHLNMIDYALNGANATRDAETARLLDAWLLRPRRDFYVDNTQRVQVCGSRACQPIPVEWRPPDNFVWQISPFQLTGGGSGVIENAGIDYILPYWMARYYRVLE